MSFLDTIPSGLGSILTFIFYKHKFPSGMWAIKSQRKICVDTIAFKKLSNLYNLIYDAGFAGFSVV